MPQQSAVGSEAGVGGDVSVLMVVCSSLSQRIPALRTDTWPAIFSVRSAAARSLWGKARLLTPRCHHRRLPSAHARPPHHLDRPHLPGRHGSPRRPPRLGAIWEFSSTYLPLPCACHS